MDRPPAIALLGLGEAGSAIARDLVAVQVASVGYIDSTALALLVRWAQSAARDGRPAVLRSASPRFRKVLDLAGISVLFTLQDDGGT